MDTSQKYIKMCGKAVEIQKAWKPKRGDLIQQMNTDLKGNTENYLNPLLVVEGCTKDSVIVYLPDSIYEKTNLEMVCWRVYNKFFNDTNGYWWWVWLPRQDQLQAMVTTNNKDKHLSNSTFRIITLEKFFNFCKSQNEPNKIVSMEQLWLAFVMKELYQKTWNGENWIKEGA